MGHTGCRPRSAWRGNVRAVFVGPRAQQAVGPFLARGPADGVAFRPADARTERYAALWAGRKSKVQPSQADRSKPAAARANRVPAAFTPQAVAKAVARAYDKAGVPRWHPNLLRHLFATEVRARFGIEAAQVLLGHARPC